MRKRPPLCFGPAALLLSCLVCAACGGEEQTLPADHRMDIQVNLSTTFCDPPCALTHFIVYITRGTTTTCRVHQKTSTPGTEEVVNAPDLEPGDRFTLAVAGYCGTDPCAYCFWSREIEAVDMGELTLNLQRPAVSCYEYGDRVSCS